MGFAAEQCRSDQARNIPISRPAHQPQRSATLRRQSPARHPLCPTPISQPIRQPPINRLLKPRRTDPCYSCPPKPSWLRDWNSSAAK